LVEPFRNLKDLDNFWLAASALERVAFEVTVDFPADR
jgi:hypothetical protein